MSEAKKLDKVFRKVDEVKDQFPCLQDKLNAYISDPKKFEFYPPKKRVKKEKALYNP